MILHWLAERIDRTFNWFAPMSVLDVLDSEWAAELDEWDESPAADPPSGGVDASQNPPSVVPPTGMDIAQPRVHAGGLFNFFRTRG